MPNVKAFVSYSWSTEHETGIVDELAKLCLQRGISLIRDNQALKHGELINQFMEKLSQGDHVITVFSKPYFQSKWCMYELLKIYQRGDFEAQTHPLIADDCDLQDMNYRLEVVKFWINQYETANNAIDGIDPALIGEEQERVNLYRDISQNISKMVNFAAKRLITPLADLKRQNYSPLLDRIKLASPSKNLEPETSDEDYMTEIRQNLEVDLKKSEPFYACVQNQCGFEIGGKQNLTDFVIERCLSGEFVNVIQTLESAFVNCLDNLGKLEVAEINKLFDAAQGIVSKLVLFNIKNEWICQYRQSCRDSNDNESIVPEMSFCGVEIVSSRQGQTIPAFKFDKIKRDLQSEKGLMLESGIKSNDVVRDIIHRLYATVMSCELPVSLDEDQIIPKLNERIRQRKTHNSLKLRKNYFLLFPAKGSHSALTDTGVQDKLKELLPDLAFIRLKSGILEETFIVGDLELTVAIEDFFTTLEEKRL